MVDTSHCKVNFEKDEVAMALSKFYEVVDGEDKYAKMGLAHLGALENEDSNPFQLVLPNGTKLGHRMFQKYYKQKFKPEDSDAVRINKEVTGERAMKLLEFQVAQQKAQAEANGVLVKSLQYGKMNSKAIASQFNYKAGAADNAYERSVTHHGWGCGGGGAHYTMAGSKQFQRGVRVKGVVSRHSKQGARMQAARNKNNRATGGMAVLK